MVRIEAFLCNVEVVYYAGVKCSENKNKKVMVIIIKRDYLCLVAVPDLFVKTEHIYAVLLFPHRPVVRRGIILQCIPK